MSDFVDGNAINCYDQQMEASLAPTASITIRNLDGRVKERLRVRAAQNGRSMEAEARAILTEAVKMSARPPEISLYDRIRARVEPLGGIELKLPPPQRMREPPRFD